MYAVWNPLAAEIGPTVLRKENSSPGATKVPLIFSAARAKLWTLEFIEPTNFEVPTPKTLVIP